ncbi:SRSF protein kinase 3 [Penicillium malachiteum]|uniref:SRSF protein kinase 3 n=1 Tax=Penicillium malachiteum TaxID=1324776 RepID=UPI002547FC3B|nr:SRSF protein kinase 3 [Penicillium malachiteum]KAJ5720560.1 SRSF protein kinase 3 [Penicillium malachiteum]
MAEFGWPGPVSDHTEILSHSAEECFGGPFFDAEDKFLCKGLIPDRSLEDTVPFIKEKEREGFLSFVREMLVWLPEKRKTARELMEHPFFDD